MTGEGGGDEAELDRLAKLDVLTYEREREAGATKLGCRVAMLDKLIADRRPLPEAATGRGVSLPVVEPWHEPVNGGALLDTLTAAIKRHVILPPHAPEAAALWIAQTWVFERFEHTPRLSITSPAKRCGKSTLLDVLHATVRRPLKADNISASGVFRVVEALAPVTLLLDEADSYMRENEELRGVLNSGFERSGNVVRVIEVKGEMQPLAFSTFAPAALAGIGRLPDTIEDRAIPIVLQRKGAGETADKLRVTGARPALADLQRKLARWAADAGPRLSHEPSIPDEMGDREGDICVPLLAVADAAGGRWPERARKGLLAMFGRRASEDGAAEAGTLLLADLRELFFLKDKLPSTKLASTEIVAALADMEHRPWPEWRNGKPMSATQLARALKPYGVTPGAVRDGGPPFKGYQRGDFANAWKRYLPNRTVSTPSPPVSSGYNGYNVENVEENAKTERLQTPYVLPLENGKMLSENKDVTAVTAQNPPPCAQEAELAPHRERTAASALPPPDSAERIEADRRHAVAMGWL